MHKNPQLWTEKDVEEVLSNPVYVGMGPYPALIPEDQFIKAGAKLIKEIGPEQYLQRMISSLRKSLDILEVKQSDSTPPA